MSAAFSSNPTFAISSSNNGYVDPIQSHNNNLNNHIAILSANSSNINNSTLAKLPTQNNTNNTVISVAFVSPTFTYAAYQRNGFYNFYHKYIDTPDGKNVTKDLKLLTVKVPHGPFFEYNASPSAIIFSPPPPREQQYSEILMQHLENRTILSNNHINNNVKISNMTDKDVHDGLIFTSDGSNAYDVLFLFHQEYATQKEYDNLKKFVANGGTIVFNDANILTTEVKYNSTNDSVTLVRGHGWQYDGKSAAWPAEKERWINETQQWVGSNFKQDPVKDKVVFSNNPFKYRHTEEQYLSNPKDNVILNFGAKEFRAGPDDVAPNSINATNEEVAIYQLDYGKGKVIMLSIFSYKLKENKEFLDFYDKEIILRVLA
jgi:hypothetical protein